MRTPRIEEWLAAYERIHDLENQLAKERASRVSWWTRFELWLGIKPEPTSTPLVGRSCYCGPSPRKRIPEGGTGVQSFGANSNEALMRLVKYGRQALERKEIELNSIRLKQEN